MLADRRWNTFCWLPRHLSVVNSAETQEADLESQLMQQRLERLISVLLVAQAVAVAYVQRVQEMMVSRQHVFLHQIDLKSTAQ